MAEEDKTYIDKNYIKEIFYTVLWWTWVITGSIAIYISLVCLSYNGTTGSKIGGVLLAFIFGPFYLLYYIFRSTYCTKDYYYPTQ